MTLLDTNIVIDLLAEARDEQPSWSRRVYEHAVAIAAVCSNHVVLAEVAAGAEHPENLLEDFDRLQIELLDLSSDAALSAGRAFAAYRQRGGDRRTILPDFLIGGHAEALGAALMTRDRRLASYFPGLTLITPETHS